MIIDAHLHLDDKFDGTADGAAKELSRQLTEAGVERAIVLHLELQPWSAEVVAEAISMNPRLRGFINVHPNSIDSVARLRNGIENLGYIGLKLHPRLQEFSVDDERTVRLVKAAGEMNVPVLIDAFPDGTHLMQGFSPLKYASLARQCPNTRIIWAHMGGHYVLDFMMLAKRLPNVYFDFSYSLLYYQTSSIPLDMVYAMRSMKFEKIFFGTDYPDRPIATSLKLSQQFLHKQGLETEDMAKIMGRNAQDFFGWKDL
jgi:predicted TIM-barrel fold metal-dependent hydrolase